MSRCKIRFFWFLTNIKNQYDELKLSPLKTSFSPKNYTLYNFRIEFLCCNQSIPKETEEEEVTEK
jgi:hypothetical protein